MSHTKAIDRLGELVGEAIVDTLHSEHPERFEEIRLAFNEFTMTARGRAALKESDPGGRLLFAVATAIDLGLGEQDRMRQSPR